MNGWVVGVEGGYMSERMGMDASLRWLNWYGDGATSGMDIGHCSLRSTSMTIHNAAGAQNPPSLT